MQCDFHVPQFSTRMLIGDDGHALRRPAVWSSSSMSSKLYRSGGTPCLAAKSMKAANGVRHSSAARPSETLSSRVKFERQQSSDFLGEAALLQICDSHKFGWQLYVHGFDTGKLPHPQHFVMPCRLPFAHAALKGLTRTCQTSDHHVAVTRW